MSGSRLVVKRATPFLAAALLLYLPVSLAFLLHVPKHPLMTLVVWLVELGGLALLVVAFGRRRSVMTAVAIAVTTLYLIALFIVAGIINRGWFIGLPLEVFVLFGLAVRFGWHLPLSAILVAAVSDVSASTRQSPPSTDSQLTSAST